MNSQGATGGGDGIAQLQGELAALPDAGHLPSGPVVPAREDENGLRPTRCRSLTLGPVFWLGTWSSAPSPTTFPPVICRQWPRAPMHPHGRLSSLTAARPRRIFTAFPASRFTRDGLFSHPEERST